MCVDLFFLGKSLVAIICVGHVFLSILVPYVFSLVHLIYLHLMLLVTGTYSLPFPPLDLYSSLSHSFEKYFI